MLKKLSMLILILAMMVPTLALAQDDDDAEIPEGYLEAATEEEEFTFLLPEDWIIEQEFGQLIVFSNESIQEKYDEDSVEVEDGELLGQVSFISSEFLGLLDVEAGDLEGIAMAFSEFFTGEGEDDEFEMGELFEVTDEDDEDVIRYVVLPLSTGMWDGGLFVRQGIDGAGEPLYMLMIAAGPSGEFETTQETLEVFFESIETPLTAAELEG